MQETNGERTQRRRGITVMRAADAVDLADTDFMTGPEPSQLPPAELAGRLAAGASGAQVKVLVRDAGGFSLLHLWYKAGFPLPRHTHDVDCLYYVISGSAVMGAQTLRPGDSFFVPAGAPYQYTAGEEGVEVLEVRHGVERFRIDLSESGDSGWEALAAAMEARSGEWTGNNVSPTFAANRGG